MERDPGCRWERDRRRTAQKTAHLSVRARERPHWMELGVRCYATPHDLDRFLRAVWLECCSRVSHFEIGDERLLRDGADARGPLAL